MTKEEILEKAKRDYPIGTIHKGAYGNGSYTVTAELICKENGNILPKNGTGAVYWDDNNYWAEIISKPEKIVINDYQIY